MMNQHPYLLAVLFFFACGRASAWQPGQPPKQETFSRRNFLQRVVLAAPVIVAAASPANAAIGCSAEGSVCETEESNEFIARLKSQSEANKAANKLQAQSASKLSSQKFASQYERPKYIGVRRGDGSFQMVTPSELDALMAQGKVEKTFETKINKKTGEKRTGVNDYSKGESYAFVN
jgi:hypothetical protein